MKTFNLDFLGKKYKYTIESSLTQQEIDKISEEIKNSIANLEKKYPTKDKVDILILYIIELWEKFKKSEDTFFSKNSSLEMVKKRLKRIILEVEEEVKKLTKLK